MKLPKGYSLRPRTEGDIAFLRELYAHTREDELRASGWTQERQRDFLHDQFAKQHSHYLQYYPNARWLVVTFEGEPVGRVYVERTARDLRIMDVSLLAPHRGRGVGTAIMQALLEEADAARVSASLHVEPFNPALRLYQRLGFAQVETRGVYWYMERPLPAASVEDDLVLGALRASRDGHDEDIHAAVGGVE